MTEDHEHDEPEADAVSPADEPEHEDDLHDEDEPGEADEPGEEPGEGETDEPGDEPEASAEPGTAAAAKAARDEQKMIEKMFESFKNENARHVKRVTEIAGDSAPDLLQCPMCSPDEGQPLIAGWLLPVKPSEDKIAAIRTAIGLAPKIDYRDDPHSTVCTTCGGLRQVRPAGLEYGDTLLPCADCGSLGWVPTDDTRRGNVPNGASATGVTGPTVTPAQLEPEPPEVAALKNAGYTVIAPFTSGG